MRNYLELMADVLNFGEVREDRTGFGTRSLFWTGLAYDLADGFPATTTKRLAIKQVAAELTCFLRGYDTLDQFHSVGCNIWDANGRDPRWLEKLGSQYGLPADSGYLGPIYGVAWRRWSANGKLAVDQLGDAIKMLRKDPWSRRAVVSAWNPYWVDAVCLPPCHTMFQLSMRRRQAGEHEPEWQLDLGVLMRSVDTFLGMPFDVASYALLAHICAYELGASPGRLSLTFGDTHVYLNHLDAAQEQLKRSPKSKPRLMLEGKLSIDDFHPDAVTLLEYDPWPAIKAEMNV